MKLTRFRFWWNRREAARATLERGEWFDANGQPTPHARRVLVDLRQFCRASETCAVFDQAGRYDTHATAVAEGRREVLLRIQHLLNLTDEVLLQMRDPDEELPTE